MVAVRHKSAPPNTQYALLSFRSRTNLLPAVAVFQRKSIKVYVFKANAIDVRIVP